MAKGNLVALKKRMKAQTGKSTEILFTKKKSTPPATSSRSRGSARGKKPKQMALANFQLAPQLKARNVGADARQEGPFEDTREKVKTNKPVSVTPTQRASRRKITGLKSFERLILPRKR